MKKMERLSREERKALRKLLEFNVRENDRIFNQTKTDDYYTVTQLANAMDMTIGEVNYRIGRYGEKTELKIETKKFYIVDPDSGSIVGSLNRKYNKYKLK